MWPETQWDVAWVYSGETVPGQYAAGRVLVLFDRGKVQAWSFPFITKSQYADMVSKVNARKITTAASVEGTWGWAASLTRMPGGGMIANYHLVQPDGAIYQSAVDVLYAAGGSLYSVSLKNLR